MAVTPIRGSDFARLLELAAQAGRQHVAIFHEALEVYYRERVLDGVNAAFGRVRRDNHAWSEEKGERARWDATGLDGILREVP